MQMNGGIFLKERLSTRLNSHQSILWQTLLRLGIADVDRPVYLMYPVDSCCIQCGQNRKEYGSVTLISMISSTYCKSL